MSMFSKAVRKKSKLRLALIGPSGSGKSLSALLIARGIGGRVAVLDSERGSASLYAGAAGEFDVCELDDFAPQTYTNAIRAAEKEGYDVIIIDSLSHAWSGKGGALEMKDAATKRSRSGNSFDAWREVTPHHNALVDTMVSSKCHVIVTMRSKTEYVLEENERGKKVPRKVGMAPIQRDGLEYEFTLVGEMDYEHNFIVSKSRCYMPDGTNMFDNAVVPKPGQDFAESLLGWLSNGVEAAPRAPVTETAANGESETASAIHQPQDYVGNAARASAALAAAAKHGFTPDPLAQLLDVALPKCEHIEDFAAVAWDLADLIGVPSAKPEWKRFADACGEREVVWRDAVKLAQQRGAA